MEETCPKVSVIVPVFNAAKYLDGCIQSILDQSLKEIEIILINDGSTDDSLSILQSFEKKDSRIKIISQINKGPGASRNAGIKIANGEYIGFVDSDDTIEKEMFSSLYYGAFQNNCDFAVCNANIISNTGDKHKRLKFEPGILDFELNRAEEFRKLLRFKYDYGNWNKLFKREILNKNKIRFSEHIIKGEDLLFNLLYFLYCQQGIAIDESMYNYYVRNESITQNNRIPVLKEFSSVVEIFEKLNSQSKTYKISEIFHHEMAKICYYELLKDIHYITHVNSSSRFKEKEILARINIFNKFNYFKRLSYSNLSPAGKLKLFLLKNNMFGLYAYMEILYKRIS